MRGAALAVTACLLVGCAPQFDIGGGAWGKPGAHIQQITLDEMDCARTASHAYWTPESVVGGLADVVRVKIEDSQMTGAFSRCMAGKGYRAVGS